MRSPSAGSRPVRTSITALLVMCLTVIGLAVGPAKPAQAVEPPACDKPYACLGIQSMSAVKSVEFEGISGNDGTHLVIRGDESPASQRQWYLVTNSDGTAQIVNQASAKCVDVWQSDNTLVEWVCAGQPTQKWYFQPVAGSDRDFVIRNAANGLCMDVLRDARHDNAWVGVDNCTRAKNQVWWLSRGSDYDAVGAELKKLAAAYAATTTCATNKDRCRILRNLLTSP